MKSETINLNKIACGKIILKPKFVEMKLCKLINHENHARLCFRSQQLCFRTNFAQYSLAKNRWRENKFR